VSTPSDHRFLEGAFGPVTEELDFTADPVARVHLPARIPLGFHGSWLPDR
jgi:carotenoid cleavage dioxygenase-like enzyme